MCRSFLGSLAGVKASGVEVGYCSHTATAYNKRYFFFQGLIYPFCQ